MMCVKPIFLFKNIDLKKYPNGMEVPCGKCLLCRIQRRDEWTMRMEHELSTSTGGAFVTLTYANLINKETGEIIEITNLNKRHLKKFIEELRKRLPDRKIKYLAVGEYGGETQRPHYHLIIFNMHKGVDDKLLQDTWRRGNVDVGTAEKRSMRYTVKYMMKAFDGDQAEELYKDKVKPFKWQSRGIGLEFAMKNKDQLSELLGVPENGVVKSVPRYYIEKLGLDKDTLSVMSECKKRDRKLSDRDYLKNSKKFATYYKRFLEKNKLKEQEIHAKINLRKDKI